MFLKSVKISVLLQSIICSLLITLAGAAVAQETLPSPLPEELFPKLEQILEQAVTQSPIMLQKNLERAQAEATRYLSSAALYPNVNSAISYSINTSSPTDSTGVESKADGLYYSLSLYQPIFHWGAIKAQSDSAKIGIKIAEKNYAEAYRNLALTIRSQFMELIVLKLKGRNAEFALKVAQDTLNNSEQRLSKGTASPGEIIPLRLAVDEQRLLCDQSAMELEHAINFLIQTAGLDKLDVADIPDDIPTGILHYNDTALGSNVGTFLRQGIDNTYTAQSLQSAIDQADLNYKIQKYRLFPKLGFSAGISQANSTSATATTVTQAGVYSESINLTLSWSIFDGFATRGAKLAALSAKRISERYLVDYKKTTQLQADRQRQQLEFSYRGMKISEVRRDLALGVLRKANEDLSRGFSSQGAVDAATVVFNQSNLTAFINRAAFLNQSASLQSLIGLDPALEKLPARYSR